MHFAAIFMQLFAKKAFLEITNGWRGNRQAPTVFLMFWYKQQQPRDLELRVFHVSQKQSIPSMQICHIAAILETYSNLG